VETSPNVIGVIATKERGRRGRGNYFIDPHKNEDLSRVGSGRWWRSEGKAKEEKNVNPEIKRKKKGSLEKEERGVKDLINNRGV